MAASASIAPEVAAEAAIAAMRRGNLLSAYDIAERGLRDAPDDLELKYLSVLALARSGATETRIAAVRAARPRWLCRCPGASRRRHSGSRRPSGQGSRSRDPGTGAGPSPAARSRRL